MSSCVITQQNASLQYVGKDHDIGMTEKIIIHDREIAEINHSSVKLDYKNNSISEILHLVASSRIEEDVIIL